MIRFVFKWFFRLVFAAVVLVVIATVVALLSYNSILRNAIEYNIRAQTGMDAEIGRFHCSLFEPVIEIQNLEIYNPANFGGAPFLNIPELHIEYDRSALLKRQLHVTLMRLNLAELDVVKNQRGQLNVFALVPQIPPQTSGIASSASNPGMAPSAAQSGKAPAHGTPGAARPVVPPAAESGIVSPAINFEKRTGYVFTGIDTLNVSFGREKFIDLRNPGDDFEQAVGLENCLVPHVKSANDLDGLILLIDLKSDHFFDRVAGRKNTDPLKSALQSLGVPF